MPVPVVVVECLYGAIKSEFTLRPMCRKGLPFHRICTWQEKWQSAPSTQVKHTAAERQVD